MANTRLQVKMLVDFMASGFGTVDDEYDEIEKGLGELFPEAELQFERQVYMHKLKEKEYDIFVFDWGGLLPGCEDLTHSIYRSLLAETRKYEKDRLYILWSSFTERFFKDAANEEFPEFISPNVVYSQDENYDKRCRLFFGLPEKTPVDNSGKYPALITPPKRPLVGLSVFCQIGDDLVNIIREEADGRQVIDCGAGEGLLGNKLPDAVSLDIMPQNNPKVRQVDCTRYPFDDEMMPVFIRPCHSGFVEDTLLYAMHRVKSSLYVGLLKNVDDDLGVFSKLAVPIHEEWVGQEGERIWRIPFVKELAFDKVGSSVKDIDNG